MKRTTSTSGTGLLGVAILTSWIAAGSCPASELPEIPRFGVFETSLQHKADCDNPYWAIEASAELSGPDDKKVTVDLFWDGDKTWRLRYSPPTVGRWRWRTTSKDAGLGGKSGEFRCVKSNLRGGIRPMKDFPFHLEYEEGTPYWLFGDTLWDLYGADPPKKFTRETFEQYVKLRAGQKFNFVEGILTSPPSGNEGGPLFLDEEERRINEKFFRETDHRVAFMNRHGVTPMIFLSRGAYQTKYVYVWSNLTDQEACNRYGRYVVSRYGAYNVCFGLGGEIDKNPKDANHKKCIAVGEHLLQHNPQGQMICIHPHAHQASTRQYNGKAWMHFGDYQQNYGNLHGGILESRFKDPATRMPWPKVSRKPVVNGEYALFMRDQNGDGKVDKPNSQSLAAMRRGILPWGADTLSPAGV